MRNRGRRWHTVLLSAVAILALVVIAGCGSSSDDSGGAATAAGTAPDSGAPAVAPPSEPVKTEWGTFTLSPSTVSKVEDGESINVVLSVNGQATPVYGEQFKYGFSQGLKEGEKKYGVKMSGKLIGPNEPEASTQISQIEAELSTHSADCLAMDPGSNPAFAQVINEAAEEGIPVFTTSTDVEGSHRLSTFHTDWEKEGAAAAKASLEQLKAQGVSLKQVMMTTGAIDQEWAQVRMSGFMDEMKKLLPGVEFLNTPKTALNTGVEPSTVYSKVRAFVQGHPGVQLIYQTDLGSEAVDKVITDLHLEGKTFSAGHNVSEGILAAIKEGLQLVTIDQQFQDQGSFGPEACAAFVGQGKILPNTNDALPITKSNLAEAEAEFRRSTTGG